MESGGKPLLGKDPSNICRLEWQSEEFLNAVFYRKGEYRPLEPHTRVFSINIRDVKNTKQKIIVVNYWTGIRVIGNTLQ